MLLPPINFIFKLLQQHSTVQIWLYEQLAIRIEGKIRVSIVSNIRIWQIILTELQGFDEFMNLVIDDAVEVKLATKSGEESRRSLGELHEWIDGRTEVLTKFIGQILLKGDNVSLIQSLQG